MKKKQSQGLVALGVYGFGEVEPVILAALVTEDPLLLVGRSGTGKTHLLNTLSEALGLEHRHYNASLVSFDDLVGFPFPEEDKGGVRFLETPATVWPAESVLVDEISRCKPEHQNRLFSLVHERRIQGIALPNLRYRWAAMNPCTLEEGGGDYAGSEPLDKALADRFGLLVQAVDWEDLSEEEQRLVADPSGEGRVTETDGEFRKRIALWRSRFLDLLPECPAHVVEYARAAASALNLAGVRISPRRSRMLSRSLLAAEIVGGAPKEALYRLILSCSLPHPAWGEKVAEEVLRAAHRTAWDASMLKGPERWVHRFHLEPRLERKLALLMRAPDADVATVALCQFLAGREKLRAAAFAFALYPAALEGRLPLKAEAVADLGRLASPILKVDVEVSWQEAPHLKGTVHPGFATVAPYLRKLARARRERATQLFYWALGENLDVEHPERIEREFDACVRALREAR